MTLETLSVTGSSSESHCLSVPVDATDFILATEAEPNGHISCSLQYGSVEQCTSLPVKAGKDNDGRLCLRNDEGALNNAALFFVKTHPKALTTEFLSQFCFVPMHQE
jgi:hypothetical protein